MRTLFRVALGCVLSLGLLSPVEAVEKKKRHFFMKHDTAVAYTLQAVAQQYVPAANAAIILSAESLFAALGGALLLGERLTPVGYAGAGLIVVAILVVEAVPALTAARRQAAV